jgi:hypothetical protein
MQVVDYGCSKPPVLKEDRIVNMKDLTNRKRKAANHNNSNEALNYMSFDSITRSEPRNKDADHAIEI